MTQELPPPMRRLTQPPLGRLIQPPLGRLIQPPRTGPRRFIQTPALASGEEASQAPPTAARIAALDHFPMLLRNKRLLSVWMPSAGIFSKSDDSLIMKGNPFSALQFLCFGRSVSVSKCVAGAFALRALFSSRLAKWSRETQNSLRRAMYAELRRSLGLA